ncbi:sugar ABC transporter permease [Actinoplanes sp. NPDC026619]|uniref:carbohydrate ABC transporter permease n=1 Tax=Actinoplanes sp. NPDC026619 TaxID=3155798 RepID=UPI0033E93FA6
MFRRRGHLLAILFILPAAVVYGLFILYPLVRDVLMSFTDNTGGPASAFVGADQYRTLLGDPVARDALWHTVVYAAVVLVVQTTLGLLFATLLTRRPRIRRTVSSVLLLPALMSPVMASFIWSYLYRPDGGINTFLGSIGLHALQQIWLGDASIALYAIAAVNIWMFAGYSCIIFLAGYAGIPQELLDAADLDGAGWWQRFRKVEWAMLAPALTVNVTLSLIGSLGVFDYPLVLTGGGPVGSTNTLALLVYQDIFRNSDFGMGAATAVVLLVLVLVVSSSAGALLRRRERVL